MAGRNISPSRSTKGSGHGVVVVLGVGDTAGLGVAVNCIGVPVGGTGVLVGGIGVCVGPPGVELGTGVFVGGIGVALGMGVFVGNDGVDVAIGVSVGVSVGVLVGTWEGLAVATAVAVQVGSGVAVFVAVKVAVGVLVAVRVTVKVDVAVGVGVAAQNAVGVLVGVSVAVSVAAGTAPPAWYTVAPALVAPACAAGGIIASRSHSTSAITSHCSFLCLPMTVSPLHPSAALDDCIEGAGNCLDHIHVPPLLLRRLQFRTAQLPVQQRQGSLIICRLCRLPRDADLLA
jgi:hypothetical protein